MQNFLLKVSKFMYGRNGIDGLSVFLFILSIVFSSLSRSTLPFIFSMLSLAATILAIYRILSKNIYARRKENAVLMNVVYKVYNWFKSNQVLAKERAKVKQTHKIYVCPKCKRKLKVPKKRGKIEISCPCGNKFYKRT